MNSKLLLFGFIYFRLNQSVQFWWDDEKWSYECEDDENQWTLQIIAHDEYTVAYFRCVCNDICESQLIMNLSESSKGRDSFIYYYLFSVKGLHHFAKFKQKALMLMHSTNWFTLRMLLLIATRLAMNWTVLFIRVVEIYSMCHIVSAKCISMVKIYSIIIYILNSTLNQHTTTTTTQHQRVDQTGWHCDSIFSLITFNWSEFEWSTKCVK